MLNSKVTKASCEHTPDLWVLTLFLQAVVPFLACKVYDTTNYSRKRFWTSCVLGHCSVMIFAGGTRIPVVRFRDTFGNLVYRFDARSAFLENILWFGRLVELVTQT
jgi:hypothetical protein